MYSTHVKSGQYFRMDSVSMESLLNAVFKIYFVTRWICHLREIY